MYTLLALFTIFVCLSSASIIQRIETATTVPLPSFALQGCVRSPSQPSTALPATILTSPLGYHFHIRVKAGVVQLPCEVATGSLKLEVNGGYTVEYSCVDIGGLSVQDYLQAVC